MPFHLLADLIVVLHLAFILFAVFGGLLILFRPSFMWLHLPAAAWAALIEFAGWPCPLTPLENRFRALSGMAGYRESFVEHYILPAVYPAGLTRTCQVALGFGVLVLNVLVYAYVWFWRRRRLARPPTV